MLFIAVMSKLDFQHHYSSPRVSHDLFFFIWCSKNFS